MDFSNDIVVNRELKRNSLEFLRVFSIVILYCLALVLYWLSAHVGGLDRIVKQMLPFSS